MTSFVPDENAPLVAAAQIAQFEAATKATCQRACTAPVYWARGECSVHSRFGGSFACKFPVRSIKCGRYTCTSCTSTEGAKGGFPRIMHDPYGVLRT